MVQELTQESFTKLINESDKPVLVDFWASWCGPCKMLAPVLEEVSKEMTDLTFAKISTEDHPQAAQEHGIRGIPCLVMFNKGKEVDRIVGFSPKPALIEKIKAIMQKI